MREVKATLSSFPTSELKLAVDLLRSKRPIRALLAPDAATFSGFNFTSIFLHFGIENINDGFSYIFGLRQ